jgi:multicomponent Na+:H+ antiporter subunit E
MVVFMEKRKFNWGLFWKLLFSLVLFWVLLVGELNIYNLVMGTVVSIVIMLVFALSYEKEDEEKINLKTIGMIKFGSLVIFNIYKASLVYMKKIFVNKGRPEVINIDIGIENNTIAILIANAITLTPGTITLQILKGYRLKVLIQLDDESEIEDFKKELRTYHKALKTGGLE